MKEDNCRIVSYFKRYPDKTMMQIGEVFGVSHTKVSKAITAHFKKKLCPEKP